MESSRKKNLEHRLGVPTSLMVVQGDRTEAQAIRFAVNAIRNAGFKAIEISPGQFRSVAGSAAEFFLKNAFREEDRRDLRGNPPWLPLLHPGT